MATAAHRWGGHQSWMPPPLKVVRQVDTVTGPFAYLRLLGDRQVVDALTSTLDHIVIDRTAQLKDDAEAVRQLRERVPVLVFVNNHYAGYAPAIIDQLRPLLA